MKRPTALGERNNRPVGSPDHLMAVVRLEWREVRDDSPEGCPPQVDLGSHPGGLLCGNVSDLPNVRDVESDGIPIELVGRLSPKINARPGPARTQQPLPRRTVGVLVGQSRDVSG